MTGEPAIDTALLLVDLLEALTGEEGMGADMTAHRSVGNMTRAKPRAIKTTSAIKTSYDP